MPSLTVVPLLWITSRRFARAVRRVSRERARRSGSLSVVGEEHLSNVPLVQAYGREDDAVARFHSANVEIADAELASSRVRSGFLPVVDLAELVGVLAVIGMGVWALDTDRLTLGGLLAFLTLMAQMYRPLRDLGDLVPSLYSATAGIERVSVLLDEPIAVDRPGAIDLAAPHGRIDVRDVTLRYPRASRDAIRGLSFSAEPGTMVAIVGPSGAGKTSLLRILSGAVAMTSGSVSLDGNEIGDVTSASWRRAITLVLQETSLLDGTITDSISFADPDATEERVRAAARAAGADEFISRLPDGYATRVGQRGRSMSGGQRQRIAIARALLRDSPVMLLDEPTTGLDDEAAYHVIATLRRESANRTVVVVSHDPRVASQADRVVVLDDGAVVTPQSAERRASAPRRDVHSSGDVNAEVEVVS